MYCLLNTPVESLDKIRQTRERTIQTGFLIQGFQLRDKVGLQSQSSRRFLDYHLMLSRSETYVSRR